MSTYSDQINVILRDKLIPKMADLSLEIVKIEPYSYSSAELEAYKRQLDFYSMIYDFLYEYMVGEEELDNGKLVNIVRLLDAPTRERKSVDYLGSSLGSFTKVKTGYKIYIDKLEVTHDTEITAGTSINITVVYNTDKVITGDKTISLQAYIDGSTVTGQLSDGFSIVLQNKIIPLSAGSSNLNIVYQAYVDGAVYPSGQGPLVIPIKEIINDVFYYGVGSAGLGAASIQALTQLVETKSSKHVAFSTNNQVMYFAYPKAFGSLTSILDQNNIDIKSDFTESTKSFILTSPNYGGGTADYLVYEYNNVTTVPNFHITFIF